MKVFDGYIGRLIPPEDRETAMQDLKRFFETPTGTAILDGMLAGLEAEVEELHGYVSTLYAQQAQMEAAMCEGRIEVLRLLANGFLGLGGKRVK